MSNASYSGSGQSVAGAGAASAGISTTDPRLSAYAQAVSIGINNLNQTTAALNATLQGVIPNWVPAPATASSAGVAGQVAYDATHFYVCVAASTWCRVAIATF